MREIRGIGDGHPEHLEPGVVVLDVLRRLVVHHPQRLDLPKQRPVGVVLARAAGRIEGMVQAGLVAAGARAADRRHARVVRQKHADVACQTLLEVAGKLDVVGEQHLAGGLQQADVARRGHDVEAEIVVHRVGLQDAAFLADLHMAARGDEVEFAVVDHLVGEQQHRLVRRHLLGRRACRHQDDQGQDGGDPANRTSAAVGHVGRPAAASDAKGQRPAGMNSIQTEPIIGSATLA